MLRKNIIPQHRSIGCYVRTVIVLRGVFEYNGQWRRRFAAPFPADKTSHRVHLAEDKGKVAITFSRDLFQTGGNKIYDYVPSIWISQGDGLKPVAFAGIQSN